MTDLYLDCFQMQDPAPTITPGTSRRKWMDETPDRYAYRCLPLTMANSTGWDILCPFDIDIEWTGKDAIDSISITTPDPKAHLEGFATSHFGSGIVTMHTGYLFRTPPGWAVWCMSSPNEPKDGIFALSGLVETDWLPFPFTMNWKMTRPGKVSFKKGESFCFITLSEHHTLEPVEPQIRDIDTNPELKNDYEMWSTSRGDFIEKLENKDPDTIKAGWQRNYMHGKKADGQKGDENHKTKRRLKKPVKDF